MIAGRRITRLEWNTNDEYGLIKDGWLQIYRNGKYHTWLVSEADMVAMDWVLMPEVN